MPASGSQANGILYDNLMSPLSRPFRGAHGLTRTLNGGLIGNFLLPAPGFVEGKRHSFATHLVEEGYGSGRVQELFGRKDVKATNVHRHVVTRGGREGTGEKVVGFLTYR